MLSYVRQLARNLASSGQPSQQILCRFIFAFRFITASAGSRRMARAVLLGACLLGSSAATCLANDFPTRGILPKEETGALRFLAEHPTFDGRGVVVAIFDTGVDPAAAGLQTTSDGKPKVVDMVDGSGSGDVDTSTVRKAKDGALEGLTGRVLTLPASWAERNASGEYHVGMKRAFELFPARLIPRLRSKRRKSWDANQRQLTAALQRQLSEFDAEHPEPDEKLKLQRQDLEARWELLAEAQKGYSDPGPIYDCVVFQDGDTWRAVIDTDEDGELEDERLLANYRLQQEYATFGDEDLLSYAVNIYDEGNLLSIVTDCGSHGTHVAGIVAAHHPDQPELNGLAPGAQIVSVKIGDRRLGSSSTGAGETRGLVAVLQNDCDLINMSYGGATTDPNQGRTIDNYADIVNKHEVIFVVSAGNNGPGLSTVGSPGGTTSAIIGVGAYVSPAMVQAEYALRDELPEIPYTWSSRGPTYDGDWGVDISAPGGAIAAMPKWTLVPNSLKNGTSMSSPNACGNIALLLSALKQQEIEYSPHSVRRAVENTARPIANSDVFAHGHGLIQTDRAYEYLQANRGESAEHLRFAVDLPSLDGARGIYLREPQETEQLLEADMRVRPMWHEDAAASEKADFQMRVVLECSTSWVDAPEYILLASEGRSFKIEVDPTRLSPGVHTAEVRGFDSNNRERGPLFHLPVTVIRPSGVEGDLPIWKKTVQLQPGALDRNFVAVPSGATWADLAVRAVETESVSRLVVHALHQLPKVSFRDSEFKQYIDVRPRSETIRSFKVDENRTLELCFGQYWSSLGEGSYEFELAFHGVVPSDPKLQLDGAELAARVDISTPLRSESVEPSATLTTLRQAIRPTKNSIRALSVERDSLPQGKQFYEMVLRYDFELQEKASVTPRATLGRLDESWFSFGSQVWQVFDAHKQLLFSGEGDESRELKKGKYVLRLHLRHDEVSALKKLVDLPLLLDRKLGKSVTVRAYADPDHLLAGSPAYGTRHLRRGQRSTVYFAPPKTYPKSARPGDLLLGSMHFGSENSRLPGLGRRPDGYSVWVTVPPAKKAKSSGEDSKSKKKQETLAEKVRDAKFAHLVHLRREQDHEAFTKLATELLNEDDAEFKLKVLIEKLRILDDKDRETRLPEVVTASGEVIDQIDQQELAAYFGIKQDPQTDQEKELQRSMEQSKQRLIDALHRKVRALGLMDVPEEDRKADAPEVKQFPEQAEEREKLFEAAFNDLKRWVDMTDKDYSLVHIAREWRQGRLGRALKSLNDRIDDSPTSLELYRKRSNLYDALGWEQWRDYERQWLLLRAPKDYPPF